MKSALKKRKILIVVSWLAFLVLAFFFFNIIERRNNNEKTFNYLLNQAEIVERQIPSIAENDFNARFITSRTTDAKLRTLEFALSDMDGFEGQEAFLDELARAANLENMIICDRDGKVLYRFGADPGMSDAQLKDAALQLNEGFRQYRKGVRYTDDYTKEMFSVREKTDAYLGWTGFTKDQWLLMIKEPVLDGKGTDTFQTFSWDGVLKQIQIGDDGFLIASDILNQPGTVILYPDAQAVGKPVETLDIRLKGQKEAASLAAILQSFGESGRVEEIRVSGTEYYATRVKQDDVLLLALMPKAESDRATMEMTLFLLILTALTTGMLMLYAYFHIGDKVEEEVKKRQQSLQYSVRAILVVISTLVLSTLLSTLVIYADTFSYCQSKASKMIELLNNSNKAYGNLEEQVNDEYLIKCRMAECILKQKGYRADWQYMNDLSDALDVESVHLIDSSGKTAATNSAYSQLEVKDDSPLRTLLDGRPELVGKIETDAVSGEELQRIGVNFRDGNHHVAGFVMITVDPQEMKSIYANLSADNISQQLCLMNDTYILALNKDMIIRYVAEVRNGAYQEGLASYNYVGQPVTALGISAEKLQDNYNGNMLILENEFFASVRRVDGEYYLVTRPQITLGSGQSVSAFSATGAALVYLLMLLIVVNLKLRNENEEEEAVVDSEEAEKSDPYMDMDFIISTFAEEKNYGFKDRWPGDGVKWKEKNSTEKYRFVSKWVMLLAVIAIVFLVSYSGEKSIWHYWQNSVWDSGINMYSVTSCLITTFILMMVKVMSHSLLYEIARTVNPKGETICLLVDSTMGYILFVIGVFICLANIGVNTTTLSLTGGVAGVIFGIGCKNLVDDILAGIIMTFEGVVHVGDFVSYNKQWGSVRCIGVRSTQIKYFGDLTIVRNNDFKNFINMTTFPNDTRIKISFNISLQENLDRVEEIVREEVPALQERIEETIGRKLDYFNYRGVTRISENGMTLSFASYCNGRYYGKVERAMYREVKRMFDRHNIRIALPQLVIRGTDQQADS